MATVTAGLSRPRGIPVLSTGDGIAGTLPLGTHQDPLGAVHLLDPDPAGGGPASDGPSRTARARPRTGPRPRRRTSSGSTRLRPAWPGWPCSGGFIVVVLGAIVITSEYSTGMIRTSLTVMPRRGVLFGAKAAVLTAVTLAVALVTSFTAFFTGQWLLRGARGRDAVPAGRAARRAGQRSATWCCPGCSPSPSA